MARRQLKETQGQLKVPEGWSSIHYPKGTVLNSLKMALSYPFGCGSLNLPLLMKSLRQPVLYCLKMALGPS